MRSKFNSSSNIIRNNKFNNNRILMTNIIILKCKMGNGIMEIIMGPGHMGNSQ